MKNPNIDRIVQFVSGLAMIIAPLVQMFAFAIHPQFWTFKRETDAAIQYGYIQNWGWQVGHVLVYITLPLMFLAWIQVARLVMKNRPWLALVGGTMTWVGFNFVAGNFGSVMSQGTIGLTLPMEQAVPVIQLFVNNAGMMKITFWMQLGSLLGPVILSTALALSPNITPRWAGTLALLGNLIIVIFIDIDGYMIWGALAVLIGLLPLAMKLLKGQEPGVELSREMRRSTIPS